MSTKLNVRAHHHQEFCMPWSLNESQDILSLSVGRLVTPSFVTNWAMAKCQFWNAV
jgi:hypothetical protein